MTWRATTTLSEDDRYEQAERAAAAERRNRPRALIVVGALALLASSVALLGAWRARSGAERDLARGRGELARIESLEGELEALRAARSLAPDQGEQFRTPPDILQTFRDLGRQAGFTQDPPVPSPRRINVEGGQRVEWAYTVYDASLAPLLEWARLVIERIPGTFVHQVKLRPAGERWTMEVTFARFEQGG